MRRACILFTLLLMFASLSMGQAVAEELPRARPEEVGMRAQKLAQVNPAMQRLVDEERVAGVVVVVVRRGKVVHFEAVGKMDVEAARPMRRDTIFRIYSMTKPVTTVAAMMLLDEGKLKLDHPVAKYIPQFAGLKVFNPNGDPLEPGREMTVRDLMRHTSGLTYGFFGDSAVDKLYGKAKVLDRGSSLEEMAGKLGEIPLLYQPGSRWLYSLSVDVLGRLIEVVSEKPLDEFFNERIFGPLDMVDTGFHVPDEKLDRFATSYGPDDDGEGLKAKDAPATSHYRHPPGLFSGGGGLVSTARDYARFCQMLLGRGELQGIRILRVETVEMMTRNQLPEEIMPIAFGKEKRHGTGFGLGFSVRVADTEWDPAGAIGEYGWGGAASTHFWISPRDDLFVVALQQYQPFTFLVENEVKPLVYDALIK